MNAKIRLKMKCMISSSSEIVKHTITTEQRFLTGEPTLVFSETKNMEIHSSVLYTKV